MAATARRRDATKVREFVEQLALVLTEMGFPPMPARVWAAAMCSDEDTLTPGDLAERLEVSPAAISGAVRYLLQVALMERVAVPGSRRQHYRVPVGLWYEAFANRDAVMARFSQVTEYGVGVLGAATPAGARIAEIRDFFGFVAVEMPKLLARWQVERTQP